MASQLELCALTAPHFKNSFLFFHESILSTLSSAKLENRYRLKFEALHAKRAEGERLSREFERRLLFKEVYDID